MDCNLFLGDCLEVMPDLPDKSVKFIAADLPYGTTASDWDKVIDLSTLWNSYRRILLTVGSVALFGTQPFMTDLICSNRSWYKYNWVWVKSKPNGWQHAKNRPMQTTEDIAIFSSAPMGHISQLGATRMLYNPQGITVAGKRKIEPYFHGRSMGARPNQVGREYIAYTGFPNNVLYYPNIVGKQAIHPAQKPVALMEYLIKTYTNPGDTVLDNTMGSGTTGEACINTGRNFIGIEKDEGYFNIAVKRLQQARLKALKARFNGA